KHCSGSCIVCVRCRPHRPHGPTPSFAPYLGPRPRVWWACPGKAPARNPGAQQAFTAAPAPAGGPAPLLAFIDFSGALMCGRARARALSSPPLERGQRPRPVSVCRSKPNAGTYALTNLLGRCLWRWRSRLDRSRNAALPIGRCMAQLFLGFAKAPFHHSHPLQPKLLGVLL
ncbi:unnamed protein product, partial [Amoebophrya sp. A120]